MILLTGLRCRPGEHIAGIRPNQPDGACHDDENDCQHDGILSDVLSFFI